MEDNRNDLATELTQEQEQALVNETLGISAPRETAEPKEEPKQDVQDAPREEPKDEPKKDLEESKNEPQVVDEAKLQEELDGLKSEPVTTDDLWIEVDRIIIGDYGERSTEKVRLQFNPDDPTSLVPDDFNFVNDKQLYEVMQAQKDMNDIYKERMSEHDKKVSEIEEKLKENQSNNEMISKWQSEIRDLTDSGLITEPLKKPGEEGFDDDPGVKQVADVFNYMIETNTKRSQEGKSLIDSFAMAFSLFSKQQAQEEKKHQEEVENIKSKGSIIGGGSSSAGGVKKVYRSGSAASIWEVPVDV